MKIKQKNDAQTMFKHKASILRDTRPATHQTRFRINRFDPMVIFSCSDSGFPATSSALGQVTTVIMTVSSVEMC